MPIFPPDPRPGVRPGGCRHPRTPPAYSPPGAARRNPRPGSSREGRDSMRICLFHPPPPVNGQNSATPQLFKPFSVNRLSGCFRPIWASRGVGMVMFELGMLLTVCWFDFSARRAKCCRNFSIYHLTRHVLRAKRSGNHSLQSCLSTGIDVFYFCVGASGDLAQSAKKHSRQRRSARPEELKMSQPTAIKT